MISRGWIVLLELVWAACLSYAGSRAVVIGIGAYTGDALGTTPLPFADRDATEFHKRFAATRGSGIENPTLLTTNADYVNVSYWIERVIREAGSGETVYLFLSARGIAWPGDKDGYIVTLSGSSSKPQSTAYSLRDLKDLLESPNIRAGRVVIFADINREPLPNHGNAIQFHFSRLGSPKVGGMLATRKGVASKDGVFGASLVNALTQKPSSSIKPLGGDVDWTQLKSYVQTDTRAEPEVFGSLAGPIVHTHASSLGLPRSPILLAALRFLPGLFALAPSEACFDPGDVRNPNSLLASINAQRIRLSNEEWTQCREKAALALASEGQKYVTRYGTTDLLPGDPLKVDSIQFKHAADAFQSALELFAGLEIGPRFEINLRQRQLFCQGMASQSEELLLKAKAIGTKLFPDIENALGVLALKSDYSRALTQFTTAKELSSSWMYPRHNIALVLIEQGNLKAAETEYRQAIELAPWQPYLYYNLALLMQRGNRKKEAGQTYEKALGAYNEAIGTLSDRAREWTGVYPDDVRMAHSRIKVFKANKAIVFNAMGSLAESKGKSKDAHKLYSDAWTLDPNLCEARYNEGMLWQKQAEKKNRKGNAVSPEAMGLHNDNYRICPAFLPSILETGRLSLKRGEKTGLESARDRLEFMRDKPPLENSQKLHVLGQVHSALGELRSAVDVLEAAIDKQVATSSNLHASPALYADLASAYEKVGDPKACPAWIKAAETLKISAATADRKLIYAKAAACSHKTLPGKR